MVKEAVAVSLLWVIIALAISCKSQLCFSYIKTASAQPDIFQPLNESVHHLIFLIVRTEKKKK